jgi:hypothetical protein
MNAKAAILMFGVTFILIFNSSPAEACGCLDCYTTQKECIRQALKSSTVVFSGEVTRITREGRPGYEVGVTFKVKESWKGITGNEVVIFSEIDNGGNCGFRFEVGEKWLIYANTDSRNQLQFWTHSCTRSTSLLGASEDLKVLGKSKVPSEKK